MALLGIFYTKKQAYKLFKDDEQTTLNAKNRRIKSLELENNALNDKVTELIGTISNMNVGSREDKIFSLVEKFVPTLLMQNKPSLPTPPQNSQEANRSYSDAEITTILSRVQKAGVLPQQMQKTEEEYITFVKSKIENATTNDALRAYEIGKEMLNNGNTKQNKKQTSDEENITSDEENITSDEKNDEERK